MAYGESNGNVTCAMTLRDPERSNSQ